MNKTIKIGNPIEITNMGFLGLETWVGKVIGVNYNQYIIDFGLNTVIEPRFQTRLKTSRLDCVSI